MTAEILAVGTEILMGQIANTNAQYISRRLAELGINVYFHTVVGDNAGRLEETLKRALSRSDIVITTGGLGPTKDDLTKETISRALNRNLVLHEDILEKIKNYFEKRNRKMSEINIKQAYLPENSIVIPNPNGTAPGCIIEDGGKMVIMLPGPPKEMQPMFDETVFNYLRQKTGIMLVSKMLKIFGIGESDIETRLMDLIENQSNPTIAPYASQGEVTIRVTACCSNHDEAAALLSPVVGEIKSRLGDFVYSEDGEPLEKVVFNLLKENRLVLATAESCTGGLLAGKITDIPGSSEVFERGYVTYSNRAKAEDLGVSWDTLNKYGAVSRETAVEMVTGLKNKTGASAGVAITGIAGPGGGTEEKPVGLVYIAAYVNDNIVCKKLQLSGNRERIRNDSCLNALDMLRRLILGMEQR
ncbi:putative competence-damage inducible protein CinA [Thermoclostridium stercorarium subsp. stercorarium DSM 8532]|uniref:Putative competence-damage inducible protein n=1 Tax=Thermoclostridium stercorarium (strain ATCC 35414 / DSM 8532 / NCIMB 11754) TaxID=1121335 RepID=L7VS69_THES1|nr:competence/damage-inducible protein A [Thermoclostridium stercorarium]AGC69201.1 putative competence-damage inducible protein CinA [Thermoclostridium stercorarium subsp. stercorarium DSM 8532]AGI40171.1 CinA [Thermoclostridium stercorarium subsp. stercorarium DSM 8532]